MNTIPQEQVVDILDRLSSIDRALSTAMRLCQPSIFRDLLDASAQLAIVQNRILSAAVGPIEVETREAA